MASTENQNERKNPNELVSSVFFRNDRNWEGFLREVTELTGLWGGKANAYFYVTSCGLDDFNGSKRKLEKFAFGTDYRVHSKKEEGCEPVLALKVSIRDGDDLRDRFVHVVKRLRARCGCSLFISDGQAIDIAVLEPRLRAYVEV